MSAHDGAPTRARRANGQERSRQGDLAELCKRLVVERYAPAAVLINREHECLYSLGPTDRYLRVPPGLPTHDLLAMARDGMRTRLRSAIQQALQENVRVVVSGGLTHHDGEPVSFSIAAQPVLSEGEVLLLICFIDEAKRGQDHRPPTTAPEDVSRVAVLARELETTNEELAASKEELQSLNDELTALDSQLREAIERQRAAASDLQNVLYGAERETDALEAAKQQAELASVAKSRFLAAASHDLRQPLQALALLQGLLAETVQGEKARKLVAKLGDTLGGMSGMLNTLLDINQIEAGAVCADLVVFPIDDLLDKLKDEFTCHAQALGLELRVVSCGLSISSDPRLLEQMLRNLLSNALKYTRTGKVLLGCRRREGLLSIEIWDTGVGIPDAELQAIFEERHQLDNAARERSRGLGLGLSIVRRLGGLLGHRVAVRSQPGKGSVFAIDVMLSRSATAPTLERRRQGVDEQPVEGVRRTGSILVVEDDPEVRELLELFLKGEGHCPAPAPDGVSALEFVARGKDLPDLILADYNLPGGMNGLQVAAKLREELHRQIPVIILTGDISTGELRDIALQDCIQLKKPVKLKELTHFIQRLLPISQPARRPQTPRPAPVVRSEGAPVVFVVDDDSQVRQAIGAALEEHGHSVEAYSSCETFLEAFGPGRDACLLIDAYLPGMNGLELLQRLRDDGHLLPAIMITGASDVAIAVQAMKAGALDFIEKPIAFGDLLASVERALEQSRDSHELCVWRETATNRVASLTPRERQIMELVLAGCPSKNIAADLGISQRTVENHRASIMRKTGSKSLPALARLALAAEWTAAPESPSFKANSPSPPAVRITSAQ